MTGSTRTHASGESRALTDDHRSRARANVSWAMSPVSSRPLASHADVGWLSRLTC